MNEGTGVAQICNNGSCKTSNKVWALVDDNKRCYRLTFSKSLAEFIIKKYKPELKLARIEYTRGKRLSSEDISSSGVYGILSSSGIVLRASLIKEQALEYCSDTRSLIELHLISGKIVS